MDAPFAIVKRDCLAADSRISANRIFLVMYGAGGKEREHAKRECVTNRKSYTPLF